jgi:hypothetical protein
VLVAIVALGVWDRETLRGLFRKGKGGAK